MLGGVRPGEPASYPRLRQRALVGIGAGAQPSQSPDYGRGFRGPSAGNVLGAAVARQLGQTSAMLAG
jgi:hypothetical protein